MPLPRAGESGSCERLCCASILPRRWSVWNGKTPLKRRWALVGKVFVQGQPKLEGFQVGKVIRGQHLALDDGEGDFHLIQPTGVDRGMDQHDTRIDLMQPVPRGVPPMRRAVIHDPEQAFGRPIRFLSQYLSTSRPKGSIPVVGSHRPMTYSRRTSQAARYRRAPPRSIVSI